MEKYIREVQYASLDTLCDLFKVSKNTVRRDIAELEINGVIKKIYGGITLIPQNHVEPFGSREVVNQQEKEIIGKYASQLVENGDVIYIDSGTTTSHMLPYLATKENLTIITSNLHVIVSALDMPKINLISTGGDLYREAYAFTGLNVVHFLKQSNYNISKAFLASTGVSLSRGVTNMSPLEYEIKRYLIASSNTAILLVDHSKINKASFLTYGNLNDFNYFVTDTLPPQEYLDYFKANNVTLITP